MRPKLTVLVGPRGADGLADLKLASERRVAVHPAEKDDGGLRKVYALRMNATVVLLFPLQSAHERDAGLVVSQVHLLHAHLEGLALLRPGDVRNDFGNEESEVQSEIATPVANVGLELLLGPGVVRDDHVWGARALRKGRGIGPAARELGLFEELVVRADGGRHGCPNGSRILLRHRARDLGQLSFVTLARGEEGGLHGLRVTRQGSHVGPSANGRLCRHASVFQTDRVRNEADALFVGDKDERFFDGSEGFVVRRLVVEVRSAEVATDDVATFLDRSAEDGPKLALVPDGRPDRRARGGGGDGHEVVDKVRSAPLTPGGLGEPAGGVGAVGANDVAEENVSGAFIGGIEGELLAGPALQRLAAPSCVDVLFAVARAKDGLYLVADLLRNEGDGVLLERTQGDLGQEAELLAHEGGVFPDRLLAAPRSHRIRPVQACETALHVEHGLVGLKRVCSESAEARGGRTTCGRSPGNEAGRR